MAADPAPWEPGWTIAPSEILKEWMEANGVRAGLIAATCGPENYERALGLVGEVADRKPMTAGHAAVLERGTFIPARFWLALEHNYRAGLAAGLADASDS